MFLAGEGWHMGFESINQPSPSTEVECNPKISISFFWLMGVGCSSSPLTSLANHQKINIIQKWTFNFLTGEVWQMVFKSFHQPIQSSEVECYPKRSISFIWQESGGRWGSSPLTSLASNQMLNVIQKWAFHFFGWREVVDGVWVNRPVQLIIRSWM